MRKLAVALLFALLCVCMAGSAGASPAQAYVGAYSPYAYTEVDAAIDYYGLPPIFHQIAYRESGDNPSAVNPYSGACGAFGFLPSTAAMMGYNCYELTDAYTSAKAAKELYDYYLSLGLDPLQPWALTAY